MASSSGKHEIICEQRQVTQNKDNATVSNTMAPSVKQRLQEGGHEQERKVKKRKNAENLEGQKNSVCEGKKGGESKLKENTDEEGKKKKRKEKTVPKEQENEKYDSPKREKKKTMEEGTPKERKTNIKEKKKEDRTEEVNAHETPQSRVFNLVNDIAVKPVKDIVSSMVCEGRQKFKEENRRMVDGYKNELNEANKKQSGRDPKKGVFNKMAFNSDNFLSVEMMESRLTPLNDSDNEEFEEKRRLQKIIEGEAVIKHLALMQEEIQMRAMQLRSILNDGSS